MKTRLIVCLSLVLATHAAEAAQKTWNGASADWFDGNQWTPSGVPSPSDLIIISNGTVSISSPVTISNQLTWAGGSLAGGVLQIAPTGLLSIEGSGTHTLLYCTLDNGGTVNWQGAGDLIAGATYYSQWVVITNRAGGVFNVLNDQTLINTDTSGYGAPAFRFDNNGTVRKSGSSGTTTVAATMAFNHGTSGLVDVQSGTLRFPGGFSSAGPMQVSAGGRVEMTGGTVRLQAGHQSSGAGYFGVPTGTVTLMGQNVGHLEWTGGTWAGTALTNAPGSTLTLEGMGGNLTLLNSVLNNGSTVNWQGAGDLIAGANGYSQWVEITNRAGGVFNVLNDRTLAAVDMGWGAPAFRFDNDGTVTKTNSIGTNAVNGVNFNNAGLLNVRSGAVNFNGSGTSVGEFRTTNGTAIDFAAGNYAWDKANFSGSGAVRVTGTVVSSGSWTSQTLGLVNGGNLSGSFTNTGAFQWTGGTLSGGSLTIPVGSILNINSGSNGVLMTSFTLDNGGTVNWQGTGDLTAGATYYSQWVVITNRASGVFNVLNDRTLAAIDLGYGAPSFRFDNNGTVRKSGSSGTTTVASSMVFNHGTSGLVDVQSGTLRFPGGFSSAGPMQVSAGGRVEMTGGTVRLQAGHQSSGAGYFGVPTGTVTLIGQNVGHLEWTGGTWAGTVLTNAPGSTLTLEGLGGNLTLLNSVLNNGGTVNWQGAGDLIAGATYYSQLVVMTNRAGGVFNVLNDRTLAAVDMGYGAPAFRFDNDGTVTKTNSTGTNTVSGVNFNNAGLLNVRSGVVNINGSGTSGGEFRTIDGTAIYFASGNYVWDKANFSGSGAVRVTGPVGTSGSWTSETLGLVNGGNLSGNFTNNGTFLWTGGTLSGGSLTIPSGSILSINSGSNGVLMTSFTLDNGGTVNWQGAGDLTAGATYYSQWVVITNRAGGLFNVLNDQTLINSDTSGYGAPGFRFDNKGTVRKSSSTGTTTVAATMAFNHGTSGLMDVQSGTLRFPGGLSSAGPMQVSAGARVEMTGGTVRLQAGHQSSGAGYFGVPTGTVTLLGQNVGHLEWTGGTWAGTLLTNTPGSTLTLEGLGGNLTLLYSVLDNGGIVNWQGTGDLMAGANGYSQWVVITNRASGVFNVLNDQTLSAVDLGWAAPGFRFDNAGTITKTNATGTTVFSGVIFSNFAALNLESGILHLTGNYNSGSASQLTIGIGGSTSGTQYGQMMVDGTASLAGNIATHVAANYLPISGQGFTAIRAGTRIGAFINTNIFDPSSVVYFVPTYSGNNVLLTALLSSGDYILPATVGMQPGSGLFGFQFPATPGTDYIIDVSSNLVDWKRLTVTNATGPVILFQDPESPSNPCRFYRVFSTE